MTTSFFFGTKKKKEMTKFEQHIDQRHSIIQIIGTFQAKKRSLEHKISSIVKKFYKERTNEGVGRKATPLLTTLLVFLGFFPLL